MHPEDRRMVGACGHMNRFMPITVIDKRGLYLRISGEYHHLTDEITLLLLRRD
ncbi:hypothetical protein [Aeromonas sp. 97A]|uniref:hypothetical protein n=1 Tax=Aeromonas sp. 97A TaxID=3452731 RepID=UPI003F79B7F8